MLTFFRRIRKGLLEGGTTRKYLVYAIGEIALVVIGILIALQINNWNSQLKDAKLEISYLTRLAEEIEADISTFSFEIQETKVKNEAISAFIHQITKDSPYDHELVTSAIRYFEIGWILPGLSPSKSTFDELLSTGMLNIISSVELRESIVNLYALYQRSKERVNVNKDWILAMDASISHETNAVLVDPRTSHLLGNQSDKTISNYILDDHELYLRNAATHYWINGSAVEILEDAIEVSSNTLELIKTELKRP